LTYFSRFPRMVYANSACVDITRRVVVRRTVGANPHAYLPYELPAGERADQVANHYYGSDDHTWMVYLSTKVIDPYHHWYRGENDFNEHIVTKYGSYEEAVERIHHWQLNWHGTDAELDVSGWSALGDPLKKYYEPNYGVGSSVTSYRRREEDWSAATNMVVRLTVSDEFEVGERVQFRTGVELTGSAEVAWANSTVIKVIHVTGNTDANNVVTGLSSGANSTITTREYTSNTIPIDERPYWSSMSCFDWERDRNESLRDIRLIDAKYVQVMSEELEKILRE
jgi:hypothetical protein